ncbi:MAG: hypothetical protein KDI90_03825, partial [Alphaproteobacteria bacterium]|nr:hypothetical protein [Alphaproteobacteria bacterium]
VRQVTDDMRRRAQIVVNESPGHVADIANFFESSEQLMEKLRQEAEAARTAGDNEKAAKLDQLRQQLTTDHTAMAAYMNGVVAKQAEQQAALEAFQRAGDALAAEEALLVLESTNNDLRLMNAQSRQVYEGMRTKIGAVPEAAAVLGTVAAPTPFVADPNAGVTGDPNAGVTGDPNAGVTGDPNAGGQRQQGPTFIGPQGGGSESTTTGTPEEQLAAIKREAARAARNAQQSVNSANEAANYMNDTVRQILELQEYARDNGGRPGEFDAPLAEARRLQQEAQIAAQEAQEKQRQTDQLLANVNGATVATIGDARAKLQTMQDNARQARQAQQRAAQTNARMQEILRTNTQLDEMLYRRRQDERTRNITGFVDGGDNGLLSNLTRDRGQPGGESFLGQAFNRVGDAFAGVREWWTRDVARYMSRSEGGKMTYQAMNVGLGGIAALLGIGMWNSTIGKWTGTQITGGMKWLVFGAALLYMLRGTSGTGDRLDKMAGRYRATSDDYTTAGASGASPFRAGTLSVDTVNGGTRDVNIPDRAGARTLSHEEDRVFRSTIDNARREANMQGTGGALPTETGEVYHRAITVRNADGKVLGSDVIDFRIGGAQQELAPAH